MSHTAMVVGLARSGQAASLLLRRHGWQVIAVDRGEVDAPDLVAAGVEVRAPWEGPTGPVDLVVKSPGVPSQSPLIAAATSAGIPVISEIELAARCVSNPMLAITGTNGKTTTTELTAHLLAVAGISAIACGNQGTPISRVVMDVDPATWLVVECSSFQLEDVGTAFHPRGAVLLNITPDHLDRHADMAEYRAAKCRIFERCTNEDLAIAPADIAIPGEAEHRTVDTGDRQERSIAWGRNGVHHADMGLITTWDHVSLRGAHNRQNALAAVALAVHAGAGSDAIARGLESFPGVEHRLEVVGTRAGVTYVNDSKATNPDAACAALDAYPSGVHLIAGGRGKGTPFDGLAAVAAGRVVQAYLIGEAAQDLAEALAGQGIAITDCGDMATALDRAAEAAVEGQTILLAPACTSFDQYTSFEHRGEHFRSLAHSRGVTPANAMN